MKVSIIVEYFQEDILLIVHINVFLRIITKFKIVLLVFYYVVYLPITILLLILVMIRM